jgi:hypothetical protein
VVVIFMAVSLWRLRTWARLGNGAEDEVHYNQYFPTRKDVLSTVEDQFTLWSQPNDTLRKLCAIT